MDKIKGTGAKKRKPFRMNSKRTLYKASLLYESEDIDFILSCR
jgi:hypothetical protein